MEMGVKYRNVVINYVNSLLTVTDIYCAKTSVFSTLCIFFNVKLGFEHFETVEIFDKMGIKST